MEKIIRGQTLDLQRFPKSGGVIALQTAAELDEYTYLVAGCVGEFWTRICLAHLPRYARESESELLRLGANYGKGLQLVNILRDIPADRRAGRCYLPEEELRAADSTPAKPAREVFDRWHRARRSISKMAAATSPPCAPRDCASAVFSRGISASKRCDFSASAHRWSRRKKSKSHARPSAPRCSARPLVAFSNRAL